MRDLHLPGRSAVLAANGMVATSHPIGAQVAIETLKAGGNAVDAAIAGALVLGIAEPQMTGIGGDCFILVKPPGSDTVIALNGSGRAPAGLDAASLRAAGMASVPVQGIEAVTLPGAIDAFCTLSAD
jgi:gamma-glutamyltranspeptidase/glutathione hydrolase